MFLFGDLFLLNCFNDLKVRTEFNAFFLDDHFLKEFKKLSGVWCDT